MRRRVTGLLLLCSFLCFADSVAAQSLSVEEVLKQEKEWKTWIKQKKHVHIDGRYAGRFSRQFRLEKLPITMQPGRKVVLPAGLDGGQRIIVSGYLEAVGSRYTLNLDRLSVGTTDADRIRERGRRLPKNDPKAAYELADKYSANAAFYEDEELSAEIDKIRVDAFAVQRTLAKDDSVALRELAATGNRLQLNKNILDAIAFQSIYVMSKQANVDTQTLIAQIKKLPGWDKPNPFLDASAEAKFLADPVSEYEAADATQRLRFNRRFYRKVRLPQILKGRKVDGSNANAIAKTIRNELPEEIAEAKKQDDSYIQCQLNRVKLLTRRQLQDLDSLLQRFGRQAEIDSAVDTWLKAQEQRLSNGQLDGMMAVAEEYLFAFDVWKKPEHQAIGCDYLKTSFQATRTSAPKVAAQIEAKLKTLDWVWLHDRWMSAAEVSQLPDDDTEKAMIESRIVPGMAAKKIIELQGEPSRKIRVVSAKGIHAIWIFGEAGSTTTVVHLSRSRFQSPDDAVATYVGTDRR